jgi:hypothetical protein
MLKSGETNVGCVLVAVIGINLIGVIQAGVDEYARR